MFSGGLAILILLLFTALCQKKVKRTCSENCCEVKSSSKKTHGGNKSQASKTVTNPGILELDEFTDGKPKPKPEDPLLPG